jgi:hypothetical protein
MASPPAKRSKKQKLIASGEGLHACLACFTAFGLRSTRSKKTKASPSEARLLRRQARGEQAEMRA